MIILDMIQLKINTFLIRLIMGFGTLESSFFHLRFRKNNEGIFPYSERVTSQIYDRLSNIMNIWKYNIVSNYCHVLLLPLQISSHGVINLPYLGYLYFHTSKKSKNKLMSKVKIKMKIFNFFLQIFFHALFLFSDLWFNWEKSTLSNTTEWSSKHEMIALIKYLTENFNLFSLFSFITDVSIVVCSTNQLVTCKYGSIVLQ